jgi:hypothetical protein
MNFFEWFKQFCIDNEGFSIVNYEFSSPVLTLHLKNFPAKDTTKDVSVDLSTLDKMCVYSWHLPQEYFSKGLFRNNHFQGFDYNPMSMFLKDIFTDFIKLLCNRCAK